MSTAPAQTEHRASARERLLAAANELFYAEGVQTVGIDRIIERAGWPRPRSTTSSAARKSWWPRTWPHDTTARPAGSPRRSTRSTIRARRSWLSSTPKPSSTSNPTSTAVRSSPPPPRPPGRPRRARRRPVPGVDPGHVHRSGRASRRPRSSDARTPAPLHLRRRRTGGPHGPPRPRDRPFRPRRRSGAARRRVGAHGPEAEETLN